MEPACLDQSFAYRPRCANNWECVPCSVTRPCEMTSILSMFCTVLSRWAMVMDVRPSCALSRASWTIWKAKENLRYQVHFYIIEFFFLTCKYFHISCSQIFYPDLPEQSGGAIIVCNKCRVTKNYFWKRSYLSKKKLSFRTINYLLEIEIFSKKYHIENLIITYF